MELKTRNVNDTFPALVEDFIAGGKRFAGAPPVVRNQTRNGPVLRIDEPVMVTYSHPRERVLLNPARDANPFFHLYESLWMLAGRDDVSPLAYYSSQIGKIASDDGKTFNGAYGYRWRHSQVPDHQNWENGNGIDQLDILVSHLKSDPTSRRAVLQMWNVEDDLLKIGANPDRSGNLYNPDLKYPASKDVCCNTAVYFSIRDTDEYNQSLDARPPQYVLDMTVTNRSNDMIWGMLGANVVHFSFLQEYMAARLGVEVGRYNQFTNNLHVYESNWEPKRWLAEPVRDYPTKTVPLVSDPERFERELPEFVEHHSGKIKAGDLENSWSEPFLATVAGPMLCAFACYKEKDYHGAFTMVDQIEAEDWRIASEGWIRRRYERSKR